MAVPPQLQEPRGVPKAAALGIGHHQQVRRQPHGHRRARTALPGPAPPPRPPNRNGHCDATTTTGGEFQKRAGKHRLLPRGACTHSGRDGAASHTLPAPSRKDIPHAIRYCRRRRCEHRDAAPPPGSSRLCIKWGRRDFSRANVHVASSLGLIDV